MTELRTNKGKEDAAIACVMALERREGREPRDTRHQGAPADIGSAPRLIEVKAYGRSARGSDLWLEVRQVEEARRNPNFYVYVIENVAQGDPAAFTMRAAAQVDCPPHDGGPTPPLLSLLRVASRRPSASTGTMRPRS